MELIFPILLAATVALFAWVVSQAFFGGDNRKRVSQRLNSAAGGGASARDAGQSQSIVIQAELTSLGRVLIRKSYFQKVQRQLAAVWPGVGLSRFVLLAGAMGVVGFVVALAISGSLPAAAVAMAVVTYVPFLVLGMRIGRRNRSVGEQLPEALDFLARILRAGHSLSTGLQMMGTELPDPLGAEFRRCYDQHSLGQPLEESLKDMAGRLESTEFSFFVTAVLIQRQTGGDLSMVLGNISSTIRGRIRLAGFVKSKTAEGRFTGYILVAFPMLMFLLAYSLNPEYGGKLLHTPTGQKLFVTAIVLQVTGLFFIKKLTTVRV